MEGVEKEENGKKSGTWGRLFIVRKISKSILVLCFIKCEIISVYIFNST